MYDDQGHLVGEYDSVTGYQQETVWFNGQPVATMQGGNLHYVYADHLGTPRSVVRAADNVELWRWDSDPFGAALPANPNPGSGSVTYNLRFPGQLYDNITGLHSNGMRDYSPATGRYIEADPIGLNGGLSRYQYVGGNPLSAVDPQGTNPIAGAIVGAEAGSAFGPIGTVVGGTIGAVVGAIIGWNIIGPIFQDKTPNTGLPGSWTTNPGSGQERLYGPNGRPAVDIDWDHTHDGVSPHPHNWGPDGREDPPKGGFSPWPRGRKPLSCPA